MMENDFELTDNLDELCDIGDGQQLYEHWKL